MLSGMRMAEIVMESSGRRTSAALVSRAIRSYTSCMAHHIKRSMTGIANNVGSGRTATFIRFDVGCRRRIKLRSAS
jgi:hypothetical protein